MKVFPPTAVSIQPLMKMLFRIQPESSPQPRPVPASVPWSNALTRVRIRPGGLDGTLEEGRAGRACLRGLAIVVLAGVLYASGAAGSRAATLDDNAVLILAQPTLDPVMTAPASVRLQAELYRPAAVPTAVDFYANDRRVTSGPIVSSNGETPDPAGPIVYTANWTGVEAGVYDIVARASVGLAVELVSKATRLTVLPRGDTSQEGPRILLVSPREGETFRAPAALEVRAAGLGRFGGITDTELLLDDRVVAESHIVFIRAPNPDEPVHHTFEIKEVGAGTHSLVVREAGNPKLASSPVTIRVLDGGEGESLEIVSPAPGTVLDLDQSLDVQAVAKGRLGGITQVELLVDGAPVAESRITFIRAPSADEPVFHNFHVEPAPPVGNHRLTVREIGNPGLESRPVPITVVVPETALVAPSLRLTKIADGTLMLVVTSDELAGGVQIESSDDLVHWEPAGPASPALGVPVAVSTAAPARNGIRYYRAVSGPRLP